MKVVDSDGYYGEVTEVLRRLLVGGVWREMSELRDGERGGEKVIVRIRVVVV